MAKKDFSQINAGRVYNAIAEATADAAGTTEPRKERKTYTEQETTEALRNRRTAGKKGLKLPRINVGFTPDVYDYIQTMARVRGETMSDFVNYILRQYMDDNRDLYDRAREFRNSL